MCRFASWKLLALAAAFLTCGPAREVGAADQPAKLKPYTNLPIRVNSPRRLGGWTLSAERIPLGEAYKPSMALLPNGELVMVALYQEKHPGNKVREWTGFWRSADHGRTWSE